jgi:hypothetical protein
MRRRIWKRRLFWTGVVLALTLVWLTVQVLRAVETVVSVARGTRPGRPLRTYERRI